jgi:NAD(P)-dependent dehydrogenase (short-subunit alcohol dehydrogenase family)
VKGTFFTAQAAALQMIERGGGRIVNLASQAAILSLPNQSVYTASKGAVAALTRSLAIDWAPHRINVNAIAPTFVWTPMAAPMLAIEQVHEASVKRIPLGRVGQPQDIAGAALFLCSDAASLITGHLLPVDGGWTAGEPGLDL